MSLFETIDTLLSFDKHSLEHRRNQRKEYILSLGMPALLKAQLHRKAQCKPLDLSAFISQQHFFELPLFCINPHSSSPDRELEDQIENFRKQAKQFEPVYFCIADSLEVKEALYCAAYWQAPYALIGASRLLCEDDPAAFIADVLQNFSCCLLPVAEEEIQVQQLSSVLPQGYPVVVKDNQLKGDLLTKLRSFDFRVGLLLDSQKEDSLCDNIQHAFEGFCFVLKTLNEEAELSKGKLKEDQIFSLQKLSLSMHVQISSQLEASPAESREIERELKACALLKELKDEGLLLDGTLYAQGALAILSLDDLNNLPSSQQQIPYVLQFDAAHELELVHERFERLDTQILSACLALRISLSRTSLKSLERQFSELRSLSMSLQHTLGYELSYVLDFSRLEVQTFEQEAFCEQLESLDEHCLSLSFSYKHYLHMTGTNKHPLLNTKGFNSRMHLLSLQLQDLELLGIDAIKQLALKIGIHGLEVVNDYDN